MPLETDEHLITTSARWFRPRKRHPTWRGLSHEYAIPAAVVATVLGLSRTSTGLEFLAIATQGSALIGQSAISAIYHRHSPTLEARKRNRQADHAAIFVLIAASYTPVCLLVLERPLAWIVLGLAWLVALNGVRKKFGELDLEHDRVHSWMYGVLGGASILVIPQMIEGMGWARVGWSAAAGLLYAFGGWVLVKRRIDPSPRSFGYHEVWHLCVLIGTFVNLAVAVSLVW